MKKQSLIFLLLTCCLASLRAQNKDGDIARMLDDYLVPASKMYAFNGSVLVARKGKVLLQKGYGVRDAASARLNDTGSIFQICSATKPFTATVILKLQEEGKLSVHDKLSRYFPGFPPGDSITIENLLTHTSGLYNYTNDIDESDSAIIGHPVDRQLFFDIVFKKRLEFSPGTRFSYNNSGYFLLGIIIEKITGKRYEQVVREMIFTPLQMTHSGFDFISLRDTSKTTPYKAFTEKRKARAVLWDSTVTYSAGSIYSTTGDLYQWIKAIAAGHILSDTSWKHAFTPYLAQYGYGWWIDSLFHKKYIMHSGGVPGFMSWMAYYPDEDVTIILLNNFGYYDQSLASVHSALASILFNGTPVNVKKRLPMRQNAAALKKWVGIYAINQQHQLVITQKHGQLYIEAPDPLDKLPQLPLLQEQENSFYLKEVLDSKFEFSVDANKHTIQLISHLNGTDAVLVRITD